MTLTHLHERVPAAERIAVRCVDSDVHPSPKRGELLAVHPRTLAQQVLPHPQGR